MKTAAHALKLAKRGNTVIYVCGPVTVTGNETWSCEKEVEFRRYTGFAIAGEDNFEAYTGPLFRIQSGAELTVGTNVFAISGRNVEEDAVAAAGSLFEVEEGGILNLGSKDSDSITLQGNLMKNGNGGAIDNLGTVHIVGKVTMTDVSAENGGAVYNMGKLEVETKGTFSVSGASASGKGDAVYQAGTMLLKSSSTLDVAGVIYLTKMAEDETVSSVLTVQDTTIDIDAKPTIDMSDPFDGRVYVRYLTATSADADTERGNYALPNRITSVYVLTDGETEDGNGLELKLGQKNVVYVNTEFQGAEQPGIRRGLYADYPFTSLKDAYDYLNGDGTENTNKGGLIYLVRPVTITGEVTLGASTYTDSSGSSVTITDGGVSFKRYSQPDKDHNTGAMFNAETNTDEMFVVADGGTFTLDGVSIDGHSEAISQAGRDTQYTIAPAVEASAPAITVVDGGTLTLTGGTQLLNHKSTTGVDAIENGGTLNISGAVNVSGTVHLADTKTITVTTGTKTEASLLQLLIDNAKDDRIIASYSPSTPDETELEMYQLPDSILERYKLVVQDTDIVLKAKTAVYVNGVSGSDIRKGDSPSFAVKTFKRAYELLPDGGTVYVVNTVSITGNTRLTNTMCLDDGEKVTIEKGSVNICRYVRPDAYNASTAASTGLVNFSTASLTGALFNVRSGGVLGLSNLVVDGHGTAVDAGVITTAASAIEAQAPLIIVSNGELDLSDGAVLKNNKNTSTTSIGGAVRIGSQGTVSMEGGEICENTSAYGAGIFDFGTLNLQGDLKIPQDQGIYMGTNQKIQILDDWTLEDGTLPVDFPTDAYVNGHVVAEYANGMTPDVGSFALGNPDDVMTKKHLALDTEGQQVFIRSGYEVIYNLTDAKKTAGPDRIGHGLPLNATVKASDGYRLPNTITVTVNENGTETVLKAGTDYTWDIETGKISISKTKTVGTITITVTAKKLVHLNATVPMYVCMYAYGGNGKVVTPSDGSYGIVNKSDGPVQVVSVQATHTDWGLKSTPDGLVAGELFLQLNGKAITSEKTDVSENKNWRIPEPSGTDTAVSFPIPIRAAIAGGSVNENGESRVCTVTYTLKAVDE